MRKGLVASVSLTWGVGAMLFAAPVVSQPSEYSGDGEVEGLSGVSGISRVSDSVLLVDFTSEDAVAALIDNIDFLDGWTIQASNIETLSPAELRERDAANLDPAVMRQMAERDAICSPESVIRPSSGTTAYLGCDPDAGLRSSGPFIGDVVVSLARATDAVIADALPGVDAASKVSELRPGFFEVTLGTETGQALASLASGDANDVYFNLSGSVASDARVRQAVFTIDGDCLAFHRAIGGDLCSPFLGGKNLDGLDEGAN